MIFKWSNSNAKLARLEAILGGKVMSFSLLSGWTCPFAKTCLSKVIIKDGVKQIKDGPHTEVRCFSASQEVLYPAVYNARKFNTDKVKKALVNNSLVTMLINDIHNFPVDVKAIRIHVAGDFFSQAYFDAWLKVARAFPNLKFYAYTKALPFWIKRKAAIPENFIPTASFGGSRDSLISLYKLRSAKIVLSESEADSLGLKIDHDDSLAAHNGESFALLVHGIQPAGSKAAKAIQKLKKSGASFAYGRRSK